MPDQRLEDPIPDAGQLLVELVLQVGELDCVAPPDEDSVQHSPLVWLQIARLIFPPAQREVLARQEPQEALAIALLDHQAATHGEVDQGRRDVAQVGAVVDQRPGLRRREPVGRLVARDDGAEPWVAAARVPEAEHEGEDRERDGEHCIGAQEEQRARERAGLLDRTLAPAHHRGEPFVEGERPVHVDVDAVAHRADVGVLRARAVAPGEGERAEVRRAGGQPDAGARRLDRHVPLVAGHVPVELVVIGEEAERVRHAVAEDDRPGRVLRIRDPDLELAVVPLGAGLVAQRTPGPVGHGERAEEEPVVEALGGPVDDRDGAVEAVPGAREARADGLGHVDARVARDRHLGVEALDGERARSRPPAGGGEQEEARQRASGPRSRS